MADVSAALKDWSSTSSSNNPSGATTIGTGLDDNLREIQGSVVRGLSHKGADIASASTTDLGAVEGLFHDITGTTTITGFGTVRAGIWKVVKFEGALTLTHNATSLILMGGANRTTADGDVGIYISEGSGNWRELAYFADAGGIIGSSQSVTHLGDMTISKSSPGLSLTDSGSGNRTLLSTGPTDTNIHADPDNSEASSNLVFYVDNTERMRIDSAGLVDVATSLVWGTGAATFGLIVKRKTADESVTSSTTLQDDDHLSFSIAANEEWVANVVLNVGQLLSTTGIKVAVTTPAGATLDISSQLVGLDVAFARANRATSSGGAMTWTAAELTGVGDGRVEIAIWVLNGANAGSVTVQFAQQTSSGTALTSRKGGQLTAHRVA